MKLASFDIFDTVLIRKCGVPENLFYLLAHRLYPENRALREAFLLWRRTAPQKLEPQPGKIEVSLEELYAHAAAAGFTQYSTEEFVAGELELEAGNLTANAVMLRKINEKRLAGYQIAFISDMYLPGGFLQDILIRENCFADGDTLFVSNECNARKDRGTLFQYVRKQLSPGKWEHYGDHKRSDVKVPRKQGINAVWVDSTFSASEKKCMVEAEKCANPYDLKLCAGLSRAARLTAGNTPADILAADFVAPAYLPYVDFLRKQCAEKEISRLYFLSRDGWILHQAANAYDFPGTELADLFVSRRSLMLPYLACDFSPEAYLKIVDRHTLLRRNVSHMLWQLDLSRERLKNEFGCTFDYEKIVNREQEKDFLDKLFTGKVAEFLKNEAEKQYTLVVEYFRQSGLFDDKNYAFVDVGWLGTSRLMINTILRRNRLKDSVFFYYGVRRDVYPVSDGIYETFFRDGECRSDAASLIEQYFSASYYPSTIRYRQEADGTVSPVWEKGNVPQHTGITSANNRILTCMAKELASWTIQNDTLAAWSKGALAACLEWKNKIDVTPLAECGNIDDTPVCRKLSCGEILKIVCTGGRVTGYDRASLQLTCGFTVSKWLWCISKLSYKARYYLFQINLKLSQR